VAIDRSKANEAARVHLLGEVVDTDWASWSGEQHDFFLTVSVWAVDAGETSPTVDGERNWVKQRVYAG
jgi:hypothetical protein